MKVDLSRRQRIVVAIICPFITWAILLVMKRFIPESGEHAVFWFYTAALMVVLGRCVVEPFFTTPADAIVNGLTLSRDPPSLEPSRKM